MGGSFEARGTYLLAFRLRRPPSCSIICPTVVMSKDLPISSFDVLLQKLVAVLELSSSGGELTPQARQALLQAVRPSKIVQHVSR